MFVVLVVTAYFSFTLFYLVSVTTDANLSEITPAQARKHAEMVLKALHSAGSVF